MNDIARHYDILIDENNDPVYDPQFLKDYMDQWDGQERVASDEDVLAISNRLLKQNKEAYEVLAK